MATTKHHQNDQRLGFLMKFILYLFSTSTGGFLSFLVKALSNDRHRIDQTNNILVTDPR